jgi:plasmid stabilization system protein ParE
VIRILEIHPAAQEEAEAAARYYATQNTSAAFAFTEELDFAVLELERAPGSYPVHIHGTRRILLEHFPYAVVYQFDENRIVIVAVAHGKRRPGYWVERT